MKLRNTGKSIFLSLLLLSILSLVSCTTLNVNSISGNHFTCAYNEVHHDFIVDLPEVPEGSPLVIMLPGYGNTAESFRLETGFHENANAQGFTVVYVTGASDPGSKASATGWNHDSKKGGNKDVEFLTSLASYMHDEYGTDENRCFAIGFSNGAFMCHRLAVEASDTFTAVVSVAGSMSASPWENRSEKNKVGLFQITGEKDDVIPKHSDGSAKYSKAPAIEDVIDYFVSTNKLDNMETITIGMDSSLTKYSCAEGKPVWHLVIKDGRHSWSSASITGVDTNQVILDYLNQF